ncbi:MAG: phosphodiester glycosidase family protein [Clostridia bacterium]|nr:phosphodiester glycosidase family protein [Clostridia bacterium]
MRRLTRFLTCALCALMLLPLLTPPLPSALAEEGTALTVGDRGERVLQAKKRLQALKYFGKTSLSREYTEKTAEAVRAFQRANGLEETGVLDGLTWDVLFSDSAKKAPQPTLRPLASAAPTPVPDWPERDTEGFLAAEGEYFYENDDEGLWIYLSPDLRIVITRRQDASVPLIWFETEIWTRGGMAFETAVTDPAHPGKKFRYPYDIAKDAGFVLGFSDDFYATRMADKETVGIIIRNGEIISSQTNKKAGHHLPNLDMLAQYPDGRLEVYVCNEHTAEKLVAMGAVNVFSFGPILLRNGEINDLVYDYYRSIEPRQALGMIEPGHYLLLSVQGRIKTSKGTMLQRVAEMMRERGVTQALNLDGGNTMALVFRGRMLNKMATYNKQKFVRTVTTLIGIGHTDSMAE